MLLTIDICVNLFIGYTIKQCKHMIAETNILLRIMIVTELKRMLILFKRMSHKPGIMGINGKLCTLPPTHQKISQARICAARYLLV